MGKRLVLLGLTLVLSTFAYAESPLVNGSFDLGDLGGVACEWVLDGSATASVVDGNQAIAAVPSGEVATLYQVAPLCEMGGRYRLSVRVAEVTGPNTTVMIGLAPKADPGFDEIVWSPASAGEDTAVEVSALETTLVVYLSVTNPGGESGTGEGGGATFDYADLDLVQPGARPLPAFTEASALDQFRAGEKYAEAMALLEHKKAPEAKLLLEEIVEDLPDARADAANALVYMQESDHYKQWLLRFRPNVDRAKFLGVPNLRAVLERYPDQPEACAMARCKIGEFYIEERELPMAKYHLERTVADYAGSEGAAWARVSLIVCDLWSGDKEGATAQFDALQTAYQAGQVTDEQFGWAEHHSIAQQLATEGKVEEHAAFLDDLWNRYRETAPNLAAYCKNARINALFAHRRIKTYQYIEEHEELVTGLADYPSITAGFANILAREYVIRAWKPEHLQRAFDLLTAVSQDENVNELYRADARALLPEADPSREVVVQRGDLRRNMLAEPYFEHLGHQYGNWENYGDSPNWPSPDWFSDEEKARHQEKTPAWNSVNCGKARRMEAVLLDRQTPAVPGSMFRAGIEVAAEGFLGGDLDEVAYDLRVSFSDPWYRPLGEFKVESVPSNGIARDWQTVSVEGEVPEDGYVATFYIRFMADGEGHHAVVLRKAWLQFDAKEGE